MTEPNIPLLRKAVEWVEAQAALPEIDREWMQSDWLATPHDRALWNFNLYGQAAEVVAAHCGAAYCVAGWIAQGVDPRYATASEVDGVHAADVAAGALGLDGDQDVLFHGSNTAADVRRIAEEIAGERL